MSFFKNNSKSIIAFLMGAILFSASLVYYSGKIKPEVTHPDEAVRVRMSVYFKLFFINRDFDSPQWQKVEIRLGPPVSAYITGLALWLGGQQDKIGKMGMENPWNFKEKFAWNLANIKLPSREELYIVKFAMAVFVSLSVLILYWIGLKCFGMVTAICSSLFFACHPLMLACATNATLDAPLIFLITLSILLMLFFYQALSERKFASSVLFAAGIGLNAGIAAGTKIQGAITGVIFMVFCFCIIFSEAIKYFKNWASVDPGKAFCSKKIQIILVSMMLFSVTAAVCFIAPNPYLYHRPIEGLRRMVEGRVKQITTQKMEFSTKDYFHREYNTSVIDSFPKKVRCIILRVFVGEGKSSL
ncbi:MAG: phospholipid carrier-dependent glycosyltransferase, partial [Candidatus Omnitrophota bacterium]